MFCSKCGKEVAQNSKSCINCGQSINSNVHNNREYLNISNQILSKEDFLSLSAEYENEKKKLRRMYRNKLIIGLILLGLSVFILPFILVLIIQQVLIPLIVCILGITVSCIFLGVNESTNKKRIDELGNNLYRKYISDFMIVNKF